MQTSGECEDVEVLAEAAPVLDLAEHAVAGAMNNATNLTCSVVVVKTREGWCEGLAAEGAATALPLEQVQTELTNLRGLELSHRRLQLCRT